MPRECWRLSIGCVEDSTRLLAAALALIRGAGPKSFVSAEELVVEYASLDLLFVSFFPIVAADAVGARA